jgi:hypothetical protein
MGSATELVSPSSAAGGSGGASASATAASTPRFCTQALPTYAPPNYSGSANRPLVFFWNIGNMHWNLVRVQLGARKEIEIYEPMG